MQEQTLLQKILPRLVLVLFSILLTCILLEIGFRVMKYYKFSNSAFEQHNAWVMDKPLYVYDETVGFRHVPDEAFTVLAYFEGEIVNTHIIETDYLGNITHHEPITGYSPEEKYTIAILGDSFTSGASNGIPWTDVLEDFLNDDDVLKTKVGVEVFDVLNFGLDGVGFAQFPAIYEQNIAPLDDVDLLIVNFITSDIPRKFMWRDTVPINDDVQITLLCNELPVSLENKSCAFSINITAPNATSPDEIRQTISDIYQVLMGYLPWFDLYSDVLDTVRSEPSRLTLNISFAPLYSIEQGLQVSVETLEQLDSLSPELLVIHNPERSEILRDEITNEHLFRLMEDFEDIQLMLDYFPVATPEEIETWFNLPYDIHWSDIGATIYGEVMYKKLVDYFADSQ